MGKTLHNKASRTAFGHQKNKNNFRLMIYLIICIYSSANLKTGKCSFSSWKQHSSGKLHISGSSSNSFSAKT